MMRRAKQKKHTVKLRHLLYLVLVTSVISSTTLARFALRENTTAEATIAAFVSETDLKLDLGTIGALVPNKTEEIHFHVTNSDGTRTGEVPVNYEIQIETTGNLPLKFSLTPAGITSTKDKTASKQVGALDEALCAKGGTLPSKAIGGETTHTYTLLITWPSNEDVEEYSNEIDHLAVKIKTEQAGKDDG